MNILLIALMLLALEMAAVSGRAGTVSSSLHFYKGPNNGAHAIQVEFSSETLRSRIGEFLQISPRIVAEGESKLNVSYTIQGGLMVGYFRSHKLSKDQNQAVENILMRYAYLRGIGFSKEFSQRLVLSKASQKQKDPIELHVLTSFPELTGATFAPSPSDRRDDPSRICRTIVDGKTQFRFCFDRYPGGNFGMVEMRRQLGSR